MFSSQFPQYQQFEPTVPVWCVTPGEGRTFHRFFDTNPISPSGRYLAACRLPFEDRINVPGDEAAIVLVDLQEGTEKVVATTRGWEFQMGANLNWGSTDHELILNDVNAAGDGSEIVKLDPLRGTEQRFEGGVYHVSPCGRYAAAASLEKMQRTQLGYGVLIPQEKVGQNVGAPEDDGLFITDLQTGERKLVFSLAQAAEHIEELKGGAVADWELYGFHAKWSPDGQRLIFTVRRFLTDGPLRFALLSLGRWTHQRLRFDVFTLKPDGTDVHNAVPAVHWENGGHHINWYPDSQSLSMNLGGYAPEMRLVRVGYDGSDLRPIHPDLLGSGHPTVHPNGTHILTDAYTHEPMAFPDTTVPLRWIDIAGTEECLVRIGARVEPQPDTAMRVDPHPAWDKSWRYVTFNGVIPGDNTRRVFVADMGFLVKGGYGGDGWVRR